MHFYFFLWFHLGKSSGCRVKLFKMVFKNVILHIFLKALFYYCYNFDSQGFVVRQV